jgi:formate-dependent nitrite reductase membrane component NrfD
MNFFVADPHWGVWVIAYFFLGGIAAGGYFLAVLIDSFGRPEDRPLARIAYLGAFPLVLVCGLVLTIDLGRPERFWHMLFKSEVVKEAFAEGFPFSGAGWRLAVRAPAFKYWSPMSAGSWGLSVFGACAFVSFVAAAWPHRRVGRWLDRPFVRWPVRVVGLVSAFYVASYTGSLLTASNQPLWSDTTWLSALFFASAISTALAAMALVAWRRKLGTPEGRERLEGADLWAIGLELVVFAAFLASLGGYLTAVLGTVRGWVLVAGVPVVGLLVPLLIRRVAGRRPWSAPVAAACVLLGGLLLRYGAVTVNVELLDRGPALLAGSRPEDRGPPGPAGFDPEDDREVGQAGADPDNHGPVVRPRSKFPVQQ